MAFYTTRHWQTAGRLVQKLNDCTVALVASILRISPSLSHVPPPCIVAKFLFLWFLYCAVAQSCVDENIKYKEHLPVRATHRDN